MSSPHITHTSDAAFETDVLKSDTPVLVDFWAEWCGPCKMIAPILEEAAGHYEGKIRIAKLNVDENAAWAAKFHVDWANWKAPPITWLSSAAAG